MRWSLFLAAAGLLISMVTSLGCGGTSAVDLTQAPVVPDRKADPDTGGVDSKPDEGDVQPGSGEATPTPSPTPTSTPTATPTATPSATPMPDEGRVQPPAEPYFRYLCEESLPIGSLVTFTSQADSETIGSALRMEFVDGELSPALRNPLWVQTGVRSGTLLVTGVPTRGVGTLYLANADYVYRRLDLKEIGTQPVLSSEFLSALAARNLPVRSYGTHDRRLLVPVGGSYALLDAPGGRPQERIAISPKQAVSPRFDRTGTRLVFDSWASGSVQQSVYKKTGGQWRHQATLQGAHGLVFLSGDRAAWVEGRSGRWNVVVGDLTSSIRIGRISFPETDGSRLPTIHILSGSDAASLTLISAVEQIRRESTVRVRLEIGRVEVYRWSSASGLRLVDRSEYPDETFHIVSRSPETHGTKSFLLSRIDGRQGEEPEFTLPGRYGSHLFRLRDGSLERVTQSACVNPTRMEVRP